MNYTIIFKCLFYLSAHKTTIIVHYFYKLNSIIWKVSQSLTMHPTPSPAPALFPWAHHLWSYFCPAGHNQDYLLIPLFLGL